MAVLTSANARGKYMDFDSRRAVIGYILNPEKLTHNIYGSLIVDIETSVEEMTNTARLYNKDRGVRLRHFIISFDDYEISDFSELKSLAREVAYVIAHRYEVVYAVHENTGSLHLHLVFNSVSYVDGERYSGRYKEYYNLFSALKHVMKRFGICRFYYVPTN